jgi:site-specific recombinase XerD
MLDDYLYSYLPGEKGRSPNTVLSYANSSQQLFEFMGKPPHEVRFSDFKEDTAVDFLFWLERERGVGAATRNQRLSALKSFSSYMEKRHYAESQRFRQAVASTEIKSAPSGKISYFRQAEIKALLGLDFKATVAERRDRVMLAVLYASGARAQELCDLRAADVMRGGTDGSCKLVLHGKGDKTRVVRLSPKCSAMLLEHLEKSGMDKVAARERHIFSSQTHEHMTPSCLSVVVNKYVERAREANPGLFPDKKYSPHSFRHSIATHMLAAKMSLVTIKNFLGHVSIQSTLVYTRITEAEVDDALVEYWSKVDEPSSSVDKNEKDKSLVFRAKQLKR